LRFVISEGVCRRESESLSVISTLIVPSQVERRARRKNRKSTIWQAFHTVFESNEEVESLHMFDHSACILSNIVDHGLGKELNDWWGDGTIDERSNIR